MSNFFFDKEIIYYFSIKQTRISTKAKKIQLSGVMAFKIFFFIVFLLCKSLWYVYMLKLQPATIVFFFYFSFVIRNMHCKHNRFSCISFQFVLSIFWIINRNADSFVKIYMPYSCLHDHQIWRTCCCEVGFSTR